MQGGGTAIFAAVPLNIMNTGTADYLVTGKKNHSFYIFNKIG